MIRRTLIGASLLSLLLVSTVVCAHSGGASYVQVITAGSSNSYALQVDLALPDLAAALQLDNDADGRLRWREVLLAQARIADYLRGHFVLRSSLGDCAATPVAQPRLLDLETGRHLRWRFDVSCATAATDLSLDATRWFLDDPGHGVYVTWQAASDQLTVLTIATPTTTLNRGTHGGFVRFLRLGVEHLLTGYDHLAFLALLLLGAIGAARAAAGWRDLTWSAAKTVTAFTAAHSITLALAAMGLIRVPAAAVEVVIAASIFVTAIALLVRADRWTGWPVAFGFGLIHGLGFAHVLAELLTPRDLAAPLLGFNLGIELAQLAVLAVAAPVLWLIARRPWLLRGARMVSALLLAGLAASWMVERWP